MKTLILVLLLMFNTAQAMGEKADPLLHSYSNHRFIYDLTSKEPYNIGYAKGYIDAIVNTYQEACIPDSTEDKEIYTAIIIYFKEIDEIFSMFSASLTIQAALIKKWECQ